MEKQLRYITILLGLNPSDPKYGLNNSVAVQGCSDTRVCYDPENNEVVVFIEHAEKTYHGIIRDLNRLDSDIKQALLDNFKPHLNIESETFVTSSADNTDLLESFENVKDALLTKDYEYIMYIMPAIGRDGLYRDDLKEIVHLCSVVDNPWVQRSAYICLYNLLIRYVDFEFDNFFVDLVKLNVNNEFAQVQSMINRIKIFCMEFNPLLYKLIV